MLVSISMASAFIPRAAQKTLAAGGLCFTSRSGDESMFLEVREKKCLPPDKSTVVRQSLNQEGDQVWNLPVLMKTYSLVPFDQICWVES